MAHGLVFNIQKYSLQDGPGIRTTVFLKGCPASCPWCHNPESQSAEPEILLTEGLCIRCGACGQVCPAVADPGAGRAGEGGVTCVRCGACVAACPAGARALAGTSMTVAEVMREVLADRIFYDESGGGVTFSGGEPLSQFEFLSALLEACRKEDLHTALDTCGHAPAEQILAVAPLIDLFLYDLKLMDPGRHREIIGIPNSLLIENLRALAAIHDRIHVRLPVIPGINDDDANVEAVARLAASLKSVRQVDLLPFHASGAAKFQRLRRPFVPGGVVPPTPERLEALARRIRAHGIAAGCVGSMS